MRSMTGEIFAFSKYVRIKWVHIPECPLIINDPCHYGCRIHEGSKLFLELPDRFLGLFPFGKVADEGHIISIREFFCMYLRFYQRAVLTYHFALHDGRF